MLASSNWAAMPCGPVLGGGGGLPHFLKEINEWIMNENKVKGFSFALDLFNIQILNKFEYRIVFETLRTVKLKHQVKD